MKEIEQYHEELLHQYRTGSTEAKAEIIQLYKIPSAFILRLFYQVEGSCSDNEIQKKLDTFFINIENRLEINRLNITNPRQIGLQFINQLKCVIEAMDNDSRQFCEIILEAYISLDDMIEDLPLTQQMMIRFFHSPFTFQDVSKKLNLNEIILCNLHYDGEARLCPNFTELQKNLFMYFQQYRNKEIGPKAKSLESILLKKNLRKYAGSVLK